MIKPTAPVFIEAPGVPEARYLQQAADILNAGSKVVMLVGAGALHARDDVLRVADLLASPIIKTLPGKAAVPDRRSFRARRDRPARHRTCGGRDRRL